MILPESKAKEVLDYCLRDESIEMKTKVYEILSLSEIKANDPMFLVLALTGQIRVFLEIAPVELKQLLDEWKSYSCKSMAELLEVISQLKTSQEKYKDSISEAVEETNLKGINSIKAINKSLVAEILSANTDIGLENKKLVEELTELHARVNSDRKNNIKIMESLIEGIGKTYEDLDRINTEIQSSISSLEKTRVYRSKKWIVMVTAAFSAFLIIFGSSISFAILTLKKNEQSNSAKHHWNQAIALQAVDKPST